MPRRTSLNSFGLSSDLLYFSSQWQKLVSSLPAGLWKVARCWVFMWPPLCVDSRSWAHQCNQRQSKKIARIQKQAESWIDLFLRFYLITWRPINRYGAQGAVDLQVGPEGEDHGYTGFIRRSRGSYQGHRLAAGAAPSQGYVPVCVELQNKGNTGSSRLIRKSNAKKNSFEFSKFRIKQAD